MGPELLGAPESGAKKIYARKEYATWRWWLTLLPRPGSRPSRLKAPPLLSALRATSFSSWGPAEGIEGPQATVEPGSLGALLRHCTITSLFLPVEFYVCRSVCVSIGNNWELWKNGRIIEMLYWMVSGMPQRNHVLDGRAHWCHLANTVEQLCTVAVNGSATTDGDAASFQVVLVQSCYDLYYSVYYFIIVSFILVLLVHITISAASSGRCGLFLHIIIRGIARNFIWRGV